jgi:hypothetical protein
MKIIHSHSVLIVRDLVKEVYSKLVHIAERLRLINYLVSWKFKFQDHQEYYLL